MIVVAIIGILAAIAIPQFADMVGKSEEGATKGNLGVMRSALSIYYSDTEGTYPTDINALTPVYLNNIPNTVIPPHS
jgi:type II secretory pathway pseudopilin PulG